jgi:hypothetical protein
MIKESMQKSKWAFHSNCANRRITLRDELFDKEAKPLIQKEENR